MVQYWGFVGVQYLLSGGVAEGRRGRVHLILTHLP